VLINSPALPAALQELGLVEKGKVYVKGMLEA
jgi:hypothetical protein